jgi:hypothetical protein
MFILMVSSLLYFFVVGVAMCMYFGNIFCLKQVLIKYICALQWSNLCLQFMFLYMLLMLLFLVSVIFMNYFNKNRTWFLKITFTLGYLTCHDTECSAIEETRQQLRADGMFLRDYCTLPC